MKRFLRWLFKTEDPNKKLLENIRQYEANRKIHNN